MKKLVIILCAAGALGTLGGELVVEPGGLSPQGALERIRAAKAKGSGEAWTVRVKGGH